MGMKDFLKHLSDGAYDGGIKEEESNGVSWGYYINEGTPVKYKEGKSSKFFDGKENTRSSGKVEKRYYESDEDKAEFIEKYGFMGELFGYDKEVMDHSRKYYKDKKKKK